MSLIDLSKQVALGIDIGGTNTKFGLQKEALKLMSMKKLKILSTLYTKI